MTAQPPGLPDRPDRSVPDKPGTGLDTHHFTFSYGALVRDLARRRTEAADNELLAAVLIDMVPPNADYAAQTGEHAGSRTTGRRPVPRVVKHGLYRNDCQQRDHAAPTNDLLGRRVTGHSLQTVAGAKASSVRCAMALAAASRACSQWPCHTTMDLLNYGKVGQMASDDVR